jgi:chemotaxis-related protein WspD
VFAAAGRQFLDAPSPDGYLAEWTQRLAAPLEQMAGDLMSVLVFRIAREWLALPVPVLVEVTGLRPVHRIPYRGGLLSGLVSIRGELQLCVRLGRLLGIAATEPGPASASGQPRLVVIHREVDRWVFAAEEVSQVLRIPQQGLGAVPATIGRATAHLTRGVFSWQDRVVGLLDEEQLFQTLRTKIR